MSGPRIAAPPQLDNQPLGWETYNRVGHPDKQRPRHYRGFRILL